MHFLSEELENYAAQHTEDEPLLLQELNKRTHLNVLQPRMISGHFQGRFLSLLSKMVQPRTILEIGTYTGYATLCLAEGLPSLDLPSSDGASGYSYFPPGEALTKRVPG